MDSLWQDLRFGVRMLRRSPGFTAVAVVTLAMGIGVNTAIFSVVNALLLRSLPFRDSDQIVVAFARTERIQREWVSYPDLEDWRTQSRLFEEISGWTSQSVNLTGTEEPTRLIGSFVLSNFFKMLDVPVVLGRSLQPRDDNPGSELVILLSHGLWVTRFGRDPDVLGKTLILNGEPYSIVGVLPETFHFPWLDSDVWMPLRKYPNFTLQRQTAICAAIGRMKPGVRLEQAQSELETIARRLQQQYPETNAGRSVAVARFSEIVVEGLRRSVLVLWGAVGFVLLIACANVANLLLSRANARHKEMTMRAALGASRLRIVRQLLTETILLWMIGGVLGLLFGQWGIDALIAISPVDLPLGVLIGLDPNVLLFTLVITALTGLGFGLLPALQFSRPKIGESLREGIWGTTRVSGDSRTQSLLAVFQMATALVLLIGAGLMMKSFMRVNAVNPGFKAENVLTMEYRLPRNRYPEPHQQWNFHREVVSRVQALRGVESAAAVLALPFSGNGGSANFVLLDRPEPPEGAEARAQINRTHPDYFRTMGIPLLRGRVFSEQDHAQALRVIVINQRMAEQYWPKEDPLGKPVRLLPGGETGYIVGVVGDVKHFSLEDPSGSQIYVAFAQNPHIFATLAVRTTTNPMDMANTVRAAVWSVDRDQPVWKVRTLDSLLERSVGQRRFLMVLLTVYSSLALLLAAVGIYGVMAYSVSQRTHEIGVRIAIGAGKRDVVELVVARGLRLALLGVVLGLLGASGLTHLMAGLLFGVTATDPEIFVFLSILLAAVSLVACYIPAHRAAKVDPMVALRYE